MQICSKIYYKEAINCQKIYLLVYKYANILRECLYAKN